MAKLIILDNADFGNSVLGSVTLEIPNQTEAIAYLAEIGESISSTKGKAVNQFVYKCKNSGIYSKIDSAFLFMGDTALKVNTNLITPSQKASLITANITTGGIIASGTKKLLKSNVTVTATGHVSAFNKTAESSTAIKVIVSSKAGSALTGVCLSRNAINNVPHGAAYTSEFVSTLSNASHAGFLIANFDGTKLSLYDEKTFLYQKNTTLEAQTLEDIYFGLDSYNTQSVISFISFGQGFTDVERELFTDFVNELIAVIH